MLIWGLLAILLAGMMLGAIALWVLVAIDFFNGDDFDWVLLAIAAGGGIAVAVLGSAVQVTLEDVGDRVTDAREAD